MTNLQRGKDLLWDAKVHAEALKKISEREVSYLAELIEQVSTAVLVMAEPNLPPPPEEPDAQPDNPDNKETS